MKNHKRFLSLFLALLLCVTALPVFAAAAESDTFRVYVPKALSIMIDSQGNIHVPSGDAARIYNAGSRDVRVTDVQVTFRNGWYAADWNADFNAMPENSKALGLSLRGDRLETDGDFQMTPENWIVPADSYIDLGFQAKLAKQTEIREAEIIATLSVTVDWAKSNPVISFVDGDHGTVDDKTPIEVTDGKVPALPSVMVDDGYTFDHWEDEDGNVVTPGDEIDHDITLHPVTEEVPADLVTVTFEASQYNGVLTGDTSAVQVPAGTTWAQVKKPGTEAGLSASFMGWYVDDEQLTDDYAITTDMTAVANFQSWFTHADTNVSFDKEHHAVTGFSEAYDVAGRPGEITIPNTIDGQKVTAISYAAFGKNSQLTKVTIEEGFEAFDEHVFRECENLTSCNIPNSLYHLGAYAFKDTALTGDIYLSDKITWCGGCVFSNSNITSISIPGTIMNSSSMANVPYGLAEYCNNLVKAEIRNGAIKTYVGVFRGCKNLRAIIIPSSMSEIQNYFVGSSGDDTACDSLTNIYYRGSSSQWSYINITYDNSVTVKGNNAMLKSASKSYNSKVALSDLNF